MNPGDSFKLLVLLEGNIPPRTPPKERVEILGTIVGGRFTMFDDKPHRWRWAVPLAVVVAIAGLFARPAPRHRVAGTGAGLRLGSADNRRVHRVRADHQPGRDRVRAVLPGRAHLGERGGQRAGPQESRGGLGRRGGRRDRGADDRDVRRQPSGAARTAVRRAAGGRHHLRGRGQSRTATERV